MYPRYKSHDAATLRYMDDVLHHLHTFKDVFLVRQPGNEAKAKANAQRTEIRKKRKVDKETNAESCTQSKKRCDMNA